ncbi:putative reverse transcriptase domain-containing protein [Tanacetum coccineum]
MTTSAEHIIVAGAENRTLMLEKSIYDSWTSRIRLFSKEELWLVPLMHPPPQQFTPVYAALIHHQQHHTPVNPLQQSDSLQLLISSSMTQQSQAKFPQLDSGLVVPTFQQGEDPIECINKAMAFLSTVASRFPPSNNQLRTKRNAAWFKEKLMLAEAQEAGQILDEEKLVFLADPSISEGPVAQQIIPHNLAFQTEDLDAYDSDCVTPRKFQIIAASAIAITYDSLDESVGSPPSRVILFGDIPTVIPSTSVVAPETSTIAPVISSAAPVVETTLVASPTGLCGLVPYTGSDSDSPDEVSSPEHISPLPATSPFICTDSSETPDSSDGPPSQDPYVAIVARWRSRVTTRPSSSHEFPIAPVTAPPGIRRRSATLIRPGEAIPFGRPYRTHPNGPRKLLTARKRVRPLPARRLASRHASPRSPDHHSSSSSSSSDSSPVHSLGLDAPDQAHSGSSTRDVSPRFRYPPRRAPRRSEAYRRWCAAPLSTVYPPLNTLEDLPPSCANLPPLPTLEQITSQLLPLTDHIEIEPFFPPTNLTRRNSRLGALPEPFMTQAQIVEELGQLQDLSVVTVPTQGTPGPNQGVITCFKCGAQGHYRKDCPKVKNQNRRNKARVPNARGKAYVLGGGDTNPGSNTVMATFLLNDHNSYMLFDSGADRSFVSNTFSTLLDIIPSALDIIYVVELVDGRTSETSTVLKGCTLGLLGHPFNIDLIPIDLGSFDVIIDMDWLAKNHAVIVCDEKIVRIPYGKKILIVQGYKSDKEKKSTLSIISCVKAQKYMEKGCQLFLTQVTMKENKDKSKEKRLEDVPTVRDFPEVFPEDGTDVRKESQKQTKPSTEWKRPSQLGIKSYQIKVNLTAPTLTFPGIEEYEVYSIVDKPNTGLSYLNSKDEKWVMYLVEIVKFCDATLEKVLKEVKLKIFQSEP